MFYYHYVYSIICFVIKILNFGFRKNISKSVKRLTLSSSTSVTSEASLYTAIGTDEEFYDMSSENEESQQSNMLNEK